MSSIASRIVGVVGDAETLGLGVLGGRYGCWLVNSGGLRKGETFSKSSLRLRVPSIKI